MAYGFFDPRRGERPRSSVAGETAPENGPTPDNPFMRQEIVRALLGPIGGRVPRNIGEGLAALGAALAHRGGGEMPGGFQGGFFPGQGAPDKDPFGQMFPGGSGNGSRSRTRAR